jgi:hypothetical protein
MKKQNYVKALQSQPLAWVKLSAANPNKFMKPIDILLHYVVIRRAEK